MTRRVEFEPTIENRLHTYRYVRVEGPFEKSWPGLHGEWPAEGPTPYTEWAVNNSNREELALYLALIWRLTDGLGRLAVPRFHRSAGAYAAGEPYAWIDWEYEVEDTEGENAGSIRGFVPARSSVRIWPPPGPLEVDNASRAGLFEIFAFEQLRDTVRGLLGDATAQLNLYAVDQPSQREQDARMQEPHERQPPPRAHELAAELSGAERPDMLNVLRNGDVYVDLTIAEDVGYADVIVVQARSPLDERLEPLLDEYDVAIRAYEADVKDIASVSEFNKRLGQMLGVGSREPF